MELFNIKFVGEVEKYPELYDYRMREYSRKDCTEKAWNKIAEKVNLAAAECKEKWRNLRSTFVKNQKPKASGSGATKKRAYYLSEAMQFAVPFIKVAGVSSGNLPEIPEQTHEEPAMDVSATETQEIFSEEEVSASSIERPTPPQLVLPSKSSGTSAELQGTGHRGNYGQPVRKKGQKRHINDADKAFAEYYSAKKSRLHMPSPNKSKAARREESIKHFVLSQMGDLLQMDDLQLMTYKQKSLILIAEIMGTHQANPPCNVSGTQVEGTEPSEPAT